MNIGAMGIGRGFGVPLRVSEDGIFYTGAGPVAAILLGAALGHLLPAAVTADAALSWDLALPAGGGRIPLRAGRATVGWLDLWGNGEPASVESRRALSDVASLIALAIAGRRRDEGGLP
jgi:hypothetical protein